MLNIDKIKINILLFDLKTMTTPTDFQRFLFHFKTKIQSTYVCIIEKIQSVIHYWVKKINKYLRVIFKKKMYLYILIYIFVYEIFLLNWLKYNIFISTNCNHIFYNLLLSRNQNGM